MNNCQTQDDAMTCDWPDSVRFRKLTCSSFIPALEKVEALLEARGLKGFKFAARIQVDSNAEESILYRGDTP
jgi:hypothetical protein